eukprot:scaffold686_cov245-Skeletonema_marinoi.AAC.25
MHPEPPSTPKSFRCRWRCEVGLFDGDLVGAVDGGEVGLFDGDLVGAFDGELVGAFDGGEVGLFDGDLVGAFDGVEVGLFDGDLVGAFDGGKESPGHSAEVNDPPLQCLSEASTQPRAIGKGICCELSPALSPSTTYECAQAPPKPQAGSQSVQYEI